MPPLMNRNGYIVSMRSAKLGGGANVLNGEGPRESRTGNDLTVDDGVREVLVVPELVHLDRRNSATGNAPGPSNEPPFMNATPSMMSPVDGVDPFGTRKTKHAGAWSEEQVEDRAVLVVDDRAQPIRRGGRQERQEVRLVHVDRQRAAIDVRRGRRGMSAQAWNAAVVCATAWALVSGPRPP